LMWTVSPICNLLLSYDANADDISADHVIDRLIEEVAVPAQRASCTELHCELHRVALLGKRTINGRGIRSCYWPRVC
jgi:hypothetical protein